MVTRKGMTLVEILVAAVLVSLIAGGVLIAYLTAIRISKGSSVETDAAFLGQQTIERFRNHVACDDSWYTGPGPGPECTADTSDPDLPTAWRNDPDGIPAGSQLAQLSGSRTYQVTPADCDGVGGAGDCLQVEVKVRWTPP
jgi:prepilin-type N-terminal cleavage/methylation domain-containing protein